MAEISSPRHAFLSPFPSPLELPWPPKIAGQTAHRDPNTVSSSVVPLVILSVLHPTSSFDWKQSTPRGCSKNCLSSRVVLSSASDQVWGLSGTTAGITTHSNDIEPNRLSCWCERRQTRVAPGYNTSKGPLRLLVVSSSALSCEVESIPLARRTQQDIGDNINLSVPTGDVNG